MGKGGGGGSAADVVQYEPVKTAEEAMKEAHSETSRAQRTRNGIAGAFSRRTIAGSKTGSSSTPPSATSGTASKLGD